VVALSVADEEVGLAALEEGARAVVELLFVLGHATGAFGLGIAG
jgi:hypothetical protein